MSRAAALRAATPTGGALALAAAWWVGFNLRSVLLGVPPVLDRVRDDLGLSNTAAGLLASLPILVLGAGALPGAGLVRRFGGRRTVTAGLCALAAGTALRAAPGGAPVVFGGTVVLAAGIAVSQPGVPAVLQSWFPASVQRASMVYTVGLITGEVVAAAATRPLVAPLTGGGWRGTMVAWSVPAAVAAVAWMLVSRRRRAAGAGGGGVRPPVLPLLHSPLVWWVSALFAGQSLVYFSANTWIPSTAPGGPGSAGAAAGLVCLNGAMLPVVLALATTRRPFVRSRAFYLVASAVCLVGAVGWWWAADAAGPLFALMMGAATATTFAGLLAYPPSVARAEDVAPFAALMLTVGYLAAFCGPPLGGLAVDHLHRRGTEFIPIVAAAGLMLVASLRLPHRAQVRREAADTAVGGA